MCGENKEVLNGKEFKNGSSPRVRGKLGSATIRRLQEGLIPACAGKTYTRGCVYCQDVAHPRVCGENSEKSETMPPIAGSSPRVRGKPRVLDKLPPRTGLIPACAGKTQRSDTQQSCQSAHPRVCGENVTRFTRCFAMVGSSPRVRGKPARAGLGRALPGLIPACAGKTIRRFAPARPQPAHPRVCGENISCVSEQVRNDGSSPRVRGKR